MYDDGAMTFKRKALGALTRVELLEVGKALELDVTTNMRLDEMMDGVLPGRVRSRGVAHSAELSGPAWTGRRGLAPQSG